MATNGNGRPPTPTQAVSQIAASVVDSLRAQPMVLALVLINCIFLTGIYFALRDYRSHQHDHMQMLLDRCLPSK